MPASGAGISAEAGYTRTGRHAGVAMTGIGLANAMVWVREKVARTVLASEDADFPIPDTRAWSGNSTAASPLRSTRGDAFPGAGMGASSFRGSGTTPTVTITRDCPVNRNGDVVKVFLRSREKP